MTLSHSSSPHNVARIARTNDAPSGSPIKSGELSVSAAVAGESTLTRTRRPPFPPDKLMPVMSTREHCVNPSCEQIVVCIAVVRLLAKALLLISCGDRVPSCHAAAEPICPWNASETLIKKLPARWFPARPRCQACCQTGRVTPAGHVARELYPLTGRVGCEHESVAAQGRVVSVSDNVTKLGLPVQHISAFGTTAVLAIVLTCSGAISAAISSLFCFTSSRRSITWSNCQTIAWPSDLTWCPDDSRGRKLTVTSVSTHGSALCDVAFCGVVATARAATITAAIRGIGGSGGGAWPTTGLRRLRDWRRPGRVSQLVII
eukprot:COSAG01_NODE_2107_length_8406_cov_21.249158_9_plen_318_part_00